MKEMKEKRIGVGSIELAVRMDKTLSNRIAHSLPYQRVVAPSLRWLERQQHSRGLGRNAKVGSLPVFYPRSMKQPAHTAEQSSLIDQIRAIEWYHTIELAPGIWTPGEYDHTPALQQYHLPASLEGKRCLDVATADGFWAFEMEGRGADEVIALDIGNWLDLDLPPYKLEELRRKEFAGGAGVGFRLASSSRGSRVERRICSVYDLSPDELGQFDLVFCGDLMIHITNPLKALQNICLVTRGQAILVEPYVPALDAAEVGPVAQLLGDLDGFTWWQFSRGYLERAIRLAGFKRVELVGELDLRLRSSPEVSLPRAVFHAFN